MRAAKREEECRLSSLMMQMLRLDATAPRAATSVVSRVPIVPLLPGMPTPRLVTQPQRAGEAFTVWGASYAFRTRQHRRDVNDVPIAVTGYVVRTNLDQVPRCAVHRSGLADSLDCRAQIPAFGSRSARFA